ncbi:MAG: hypothetical protein AAF311_07100 [Pseudomonadota bacterium]
MTRQIATRFTAFLSVGTLLLSGCSTLNLNEAEPEKYMAYECQQLFQLAEAYRPQTQEQIFADVSDLERRNLGNRGSGLSDNPRPYEAEQQRERRSISLAMREKDCV